MDIFDHDRAFDNVKDIVNSVLSAVQEAPPAQHYYDCMEQQGEALGQHLADVDLHAHSVGWPHDSKADAEAVNRAMDVCNYESYVPHDAITLPVSSSPLGVALEVMFTPTTANAGENEYFRGLDAFHQASDSAYHDAVEQQFDKQLASHFAVDWGHQQHPEPSPPPVNALDAFANALEASAGTAHDAASYGAFDSHAAADAGGNSHGGGHDSGSGTHDGGGSSGAHGDPGSGGL